jgi:outer membrane protein assembly factor BamB
MKENDDFFKAEEVEEQINFLSQWSIHSEEENLQAARVIYHLRQFYAKNSTQYPPHLERAWQRIVAEHAVAKQNLKKKEDVILMQEIQKGRRNQQHVPQHPSMRWLNTFIAVAIIGFVVASTFLILSAVHHVQSTTTTPGISSQTGSGGVPLPKPPHPITGGKCTIDTTVTHPQQSTNNLPGLYISTFNSDQGDNIFYRYDTSTKKVVWSKKLCSAFEPAGTVEQNGVLYLAGADTTNKSTSGMVAYLYALNETDGSVIWGVKFPVKVIPFAESSPNYGSTPLDLGSIESPTVSHGIVYIMQRTGIVYALSTSNGGQLWTFNAGRNAWATTQEGNGSMVDPSSIQVIDGVAYGSIVDRFFALNASSGKQLWMHSFNNTVNINQSLTFVNGTIYLTAFVPGYGTALNPDTYVYAFNAQTGSQKWVTTKMRGYINGPTVLNNQVYVMSYDGIWYTLNALNGSLESQTTLANSGANAPFLVNGVLYTTTDTNLSTLNPDGSTRWSVTITGKYPFIDDVQNGIIYVTGRGSGIYAYSAADGSLLWHYDGYLPQPDGIASVSVVS